MPRKTYIYTEQDLRYRTTLPLTKEMAALLERISTRCKDEGGRHIDKTQIIRALIEALKKFEDDVDWHGIRDERTLTERIIRALSRK